MPDTNGGLLHQAQNLLHLGRHQEALQVAGMATQAQTADAEVHCVMAAGWIGSGHSSKALAELQQAMALEPAWEWPHRLRAVALMLAAEQTAGRRARRLRKRAARAARKSAALGPVIPDAFSTLAFAELTLGRTELAREAAHRAVHLDPEDAAGWVVTSLIELTEHRWTAAEKAARRALRLDPRHAAAATVLEVAVEQRDGRYAAAG